MTSLPTDPTVRALVSAINAGDRDAFFANLAPDATMSDDGRSLVAQFTNSTWGTMRTRWHFTITDGKVTRFDTGQA